MDERRTLTAIACKHDRRITYFFRVNGDVFTAIQRCWRGFALKIVGTVRLPKRGVGPAWYSRHVPDNHVSRSELRARGQLAQKAKTC